MPPVVLALIVLSVDANKELKMTTRLLYLNKNDASAARLPIISKELSKELKNRYILDSVLNAK